MGRPHWRGTSDADLLGAFKERQAPRPRLGRTHKWPRHLTVTIRESVESLLNITNGIR